MGRKGLFDGTIHKRRCFKAYAGVHDPQRSPQVVHAASLTATSNSESESKSRQLKEGNRFTGEDEKVLSTRDAHAWLLYYSFVHDQAAISVF